MTARVLAKKLQAPPGLSRACRANRSPAEGCVDTPWRDQSGSVCGALKEPWMTQAQLCGGEIASLEGGEPGERGDYAEAGEHPDGGPVEAGCGYGTEMGEQRCV